MSITRGEFRPGVADSDHRFSIELIIWKALVLHETAVDQPIPARLAKPVPASQPLRVALLHRDRKSTRLNSSHVAISYAVFCLKKKNKYPHERRERGRHDVPLT